MSDSESLSSKYNLEPTPQSVARLATLLSKRNADLEEVIEVISSDLALKTRLLRAASPEDGNLKIGSVHEAVMRTGVGCVLVLAMSDPLVKALTKTFMTMAAVKLVPTDPSSIGPMEETVYLGSAKFSGKADGIVYIRMREPFARQIAGSILETEEEEEITEGVADVLGELVNMVVGTFKSNLCDAGLTCQLSLPDVSRVSDFKLPTVSGGRHQAFAFRGKNQVLMLNIFVNSTD